MSSPWSTPPEVRRGDNDGNTKASSPSTAQRQVGERATTATAVAGSPARASSDTPGDADQRDYLASYNPRSRMLLHRLEDFVVIESTSGTCLVMCDAVGRGQENSLNIDKVKGGLRNLGVQSVAEDASHVIFGILERARVGEIDGHDVFFVTKTGILPIPRQVGYLPEEESKLERTYLNMLNTMISNSGFYFSYTGDITRSAQRRAMASQTLVPGSPSVERASDQSLQDAASDPDTNVWDLADRRFLWNYNIATDFVRLGLTSWLTPVVDGFIYTGANVLNGMKFTYTLISRREWLRTGARYLTRGVDVMGNVANFVETEQIVCYDGNVCSWTQTRGSIPVLWQQLGKGLKPKPVVIESHFTRVAFRRHFEKQIALYGPQILVSLIDQTGGEKDVGDAYETHVRLYNNKNLRYIAFDFHEKCRNNRYENLSLLTAQVEEQLDKYGFFLKDRLGNVLFQQNGNVRTNCIDCLDRTNVVQSEFARLMLKRQLRMLGLMPHSQEIHMHVAFESMLKNVWADNADTMSKRYTGVGALKTDFTRTGKRSAKGAVADGIKAAQRFMQSTLRDDLKQASMELFLGKFHLERKAEVENDKVATKRWYRVRKLTRNDEMLEMLLEVDKETGVFSQYSLDYCSMKVTHVRDLKLISRVASNYNALSLLFTGHTSARRFVFASAEEREDFVNVIANTRLRLLSRTTDGEDLLAAPAESVVQPLPAPTPSASIPIPASPQGPTDLLQFSPAADVGAPVVQPQSVSMLLPAPAAMTMSHESTTIAMPGTSPLGPPPPRPSAPKPELTVGTETDLLPSAPPPTPVAPAISTGAPNNSRESARTESAYEVPLRVYFGTCDMASVDFTVPGPLELPLDRDLFVIAVQNCEYSVPMDFYMTSVPHWFYHVQSYLMPEGYCIVDTVVSGQSALIVMVRESMVYRISNVDKTVIVQEQPKAQDKPAASDSPDMLKGFKDNLSFGLSRLSVEAKSSWKLLTSNSSQSSPKKVSSRSTPGRSSSASSEGGAAIAMYINDTSFCFVNVACGDRPWRLQMFDIANSFDHVFCLGKFRMNSMNRPFWVEIFDDEKFGSVAWRSVMESRISKIVTPSLPIDPLNPIPVSVSATISTQVAWRASSPAAPVVASILLFGLHGVDMIPSDYRTRLPFDSYVIVHAPFCMNPVKTSTRHKTWEPRWNDVVSMRPLTSEYQHLAARHLIVEVWDEEEDVLIGRGLVPLRAACGSEAVDMNVRLSRNDETKGFLTGKIHCRWVEQVESPQGS